MLVPLLVLAMSAQTAPYVDPQDRGSALLRTCQAVVTIEDSKAKPTLSAVQDAAACTSYITGYNDGIWETDATASRRRYCLNQAPTRELVHVYIAFMQQNPRWLDYHKSVGLNLALQNAYPCPAADPNQSPEEDADPDTPDTTPDSKPDKD